MDKKEQRKSKSEENSSKNKEAKKLEESYKLGVKYYKDIEEE